MTTKPNRPLPPGALSKIDHRRMCDLALEVADKLLGNDLYGLVCEGALPALDHFDEAGFARFGMATKAGNGNYLEPWHFEFAAGSDHYKPPRDGDLNGPLGIPD